MARWGILLGSIGLVLAAGLALYQRITYTPPRQLLRTARAALTARDFASAEKVSVRVPSDTIEFVEAMLIAGEAATRQNRFEKAVEYYNQIPAHGGEKTALARSCTGDLLLQLRRPSEAEAQYRLALEAQPDDLWTHEQLASLLCIFGRRWEAIPHLFVLVRAQRATVNQLVLLGDIESTLGLDPNLEEFRRQAPRDPLPILAQAKYAFNTNDPIGAARLAREVIAGSPGQIEAWSLLGRSLADGPEDEAAFLDWHAHVPPAAETHPDVWLARGVWAHNHDQPQVAIRCFRETLVRFSDSRTASYHVGRALRIVESPQPDAADFFLTRAERLEELKHVLFMIIREPSNLQYISQAARLCEDLGRLWEAAAWYQAARSLDPRASGSDSQIRRIAGRLSRGSPRVFDDSFTAPLERLKSFPLPDWKLPAQKSEPAAGVGRDVAATIRFEDAAPHAGIDFRYFNGTQPAGTGTLIYQSLGGGVAAIDFDGDLWPDLYFSQGAPAPNDKEDHPYRDRLYRNRGDGRFSDITREAGLGDGRYTLGVASGDFDNDGFPDLYLGNAGTNRLYRNHGDGTFADVTSLAGITEHHCTASCLIADMNGDACPELYDVNYLAEPQVYTLTCQQIDRVRPCDPRLFDAEPDQLFLSRGDGRFEDITRNCGIDVPNGKGLGIVAGDFEGSGRLNLFIANDGTGNFYFLNQTRRPGDPPIFREAALEAGLAYGEDGRVQASMGIAAGDADGDGLLDLYVTNFLNESSAFYHQTAVNLFEDAKRRYGLREPTLPQLGFGTQFLDADLDGFPDLIVTNGHIDDYSGDGKPYRMPPQFFYNRGGTRFEELRAETLGSFFAGKYLGRGLAKLDWNRDGKEDAVLSHLDAPAALLTNRSHPVGNFLALRVVGTESSRDAIGTRVACRIAGRVLKTQVLAGDGYMASNERQLIIGLSDSQRIDELTIAWPSGRVERFPDVAANCHVLAVEGGQTLTRLPRP